MGLREYVVKRLAYTFVLLMFVITLNFLIFQVMPGSPTDTLAASGRLRDQAQLDAQIRRFGLDKDPLTRYFTYVENMLTFNFGFSYSTFRPVADEILVRLSNTLLLIGVSTVLAIVVGTFLGVYAAAKRGGKFDSFWVTTSLVTYSLPTFWMGLVFILIFSSQLGWFPSAHTQPDVWAIIPPANIWEYLVGRLRHLFLPVLTLFLFGYGGFVLLTRATMTEALTEDYITTARAKGLSGRKILFKHALKNASLPLITNASLSFGFLLTGAIITETVFSWDGMGRWIFNAIGLIDYPAMQAIFYLIALNVIVANFISDLLLGIVDPRIKYS